MTTALEAREGPGAGAGSGRLRWVGLAIAALLLCWTFRSVDAHGTLAALQRVGPLAVLILVPFPLSMLVEAVGWKRLFLVFGRRVPVLQLLRVRVEAQALLYTLPTGSFLAETIKPTLLRRRSGVPCAESLATLAAYRFLLILSHSVYLAMGGVLAHDSLVHRFRPAVRIPGIEWLGLGFSPVLLAVAILLALVCAGKCPAQRLLRALRRLPSRRLRRGIEGALQAAMRTDDLLRLEFASWRRWLGVSGVLFVLAWIWESAETYFILYLLGAPIGFPEVLALETLLVTVRSLAIFVPAGLGLQDAGYVAFLAGFGVPEAATLGAAFVLLKRGKELFWILVGYASLMGSGDLALWRARGGLAPATPQPEGA